MTTPRLTGEQAAILSAYTGVLCGSFVEFHGYVERILGRPVFTHELASKSVAAEIAAAAKDDFIAICHDPHEEGVS